MFSTRPHFPRRAGTTPAPTPLHCIECRREWAQPSERWRLKVMVDEEAGGAVATVPYCPDCHAREFEE